jgi:hypothetical protein
MIDRVEVWKIAYIGLSAAEVLTATGHAKVLGFVQQTPTPTSTSLQCYETDDLRSTTHAVPLNTGSFPPSGTAGPIDERTGEPFDGAGLFYEAQAITPLPICFLGPKHCTLPAPATAHRTFVVAGDPPRWQELTT